LANGPAVALYEAGLMRWTLASTRGAGSVNSIATNPDTARLRLLEVDSDIYVVGESTTRQLTEVDHFALSNSGITHTGSVAIPNDLVLTLGSLDEESLSQRRSRWWAVGKQGQDDVAWNLDGKTAPIVLTTTDQKLLGVLSVGTKGDAVVRAGADGAITAQLAKPSAPNAVSLWTVAGCATPTLWSRESTAAALIGIEGCPGGDVGVLTLNVDASGVKTKACKGCDGLLGDGPHDVSPDLAFVAVPRPSCMAIVNVSDDSKQWATSTGAVLALHASGADAGSDGNPIRVWLSPSTSVLDVTQRPILHPGSCTDYVAAIPTPPSDDLLSCPLTP
jgi:WD40 repeat protein